MNKTMIFLGMLSIGMAHAQQGRVGINTEQPKATLHISQRNITNSNKGEAQGVIFPHISTADRDNFTNVEKGTMIYNTDLNCIDFYDGTKWSCINSGSNTGAGGGYAPGQGAIPATITLKNNSHFIASIYDDNYLPYTAPTTVASVGTQNPDGQTETLINVPGVIPANGIAVQIPITATGSGTLTGSTIEATIQAIHTKGTGNTDAGNTDRKVLLTWPNTAFTNSDTSITAFIKPFDGKEIQIRRLDLNKGIGNDGKGIEIAKFTFSANTDGSQQATFKLHAMAGIPDKKFGVQTNGKLEHQFIYLPIQGPDGRVWLNNNLGAEYADITSQYFNPMRQAGALDANGSPIINPTADQIKQDFRAYGYLYEWNRDSDGHEIITWTSSTTGTFAHENLHNYDSDSTNNPKPSTAGDPCPSGFHTPSKNEWEHLEKAIIGNITYYTTNRTDKLWTEKTLKLPAAGYRNENRRYVSWLINSQGEYGFYWNSTWGGPNNTNGSGDRFSFDESSSGSYNSGVAFSKTNGNSVRCIAD